MVALKNSALYFILGSDLEVSEIDAIKLLETEADMNKDHHNNKIGRNP